MKPNFLIIGDVKAGTTSLYKYLKQHPSIFMPELKELRYFAYDPENSYHVRARSSVVKTSAEYFDHFIDTGIAKAIGEASPGYLRSPTAARKIKHALPSTKLIVSIRNPADRLYSLYQMNYRSGSITVPFDQRAFEDNASWIKGNFCWPDLKRFFDLFPKNQIKIILFDDFAANSLGVTQELYRFLEVDSSFEPHICVHNAGGIPTHPFFYSLLVRAKNRTKQLLPPHFLLKKAWHRVKKESLRCSAIDARIRRKVLDVCRDDIERTQELIEQDLSIWS